MNDKQLASMIAAAEAGSFNRASEQMYVSKQALIKQINALEQELGFPVFFRDSAGIRLTPAGEEMVRAARELLRHWEDSVKRCREVATNRRVLRISVPSHPRLVLERAITEFAKQYPDIRQELVFRAAGDNGISMLLDCTADVAECMARKEYDRPEIASATLEMLSYRCLVAPSHPLAKKESVKPEDLAGSRICVGTRERNLPILELLSRRCTGYEIVEHRTEDLEFTLNFCINQGVAIAKSYFALSLPPLVSLPIVPALTSESRLYYRRQTTPEVEAFLAIVQRLYSQNKET